MLCGTGEAYIEFCLRAFYWVMSVYIPWFVQNNYKANDLENIAYGSIALNDH